MDWLSGNISNLITDQHKKSEYVKLDMFFMQCLGDANKNRPPNTNTGAYNAQNDELARISKERSKGIATTKAKEKRR